MATQIKVEDSAYQEKLITLNGNSLFITFSFNTRDSRWYFDIVNRDSIDVISGVKILPAQNLTSKYLTLRTLLGGDFYCANIKADGTDVTRDNFGTDKQFQFWYISVEEQEELGI